MKALIVGYGSIGKRHARILKKLGHEVAIVTKQEDINEIYFHSIEEALRIFCPSYIVICNATIDHFTTINKLAEQKYTGDILVEKPIFHELRDMPDNEFKNIFVGYNLRYHPLIIKLKRLLKNEIILSTNVYVGQYLPDWRPEQDHKTSYSASSNQGGGVLKDLSHEFDYIFWMLGEWKCLASIGGRIGDLTIDSEDIYSIIMETKLCPVLTVQMSYFDKLKQRKIIVNTANNHIEADLIKSSLKINGIEEIIECHTDKTYMDMHNSYLNKEFSLLCSYENALEVLDLIAKIEIANKHIWIRND